MVDAWKSEGGYEPGVTRLTTEDITRMVVDLINESPSGASADRSILVRQAVRATITVLENNDFLGLEYEK